MRFSVLRSVPAVRQCARRTPARVGLLGLLGLSGAAALLLGACGGGNSAAPLAAQPEINLASNTPQSGTASSPQPATIQVSGKVLNLGYLGNTEVCADLDGDGRCGAGEPGVVSAADGSYTLRVARGHRGINLLAQVRSSSRDTAATAAAPLNFAQGWTLAAPLEYDDEASSWRLNISPLTATYHARMRASGRNRLSNQIAIFTRIVFEPNIDPASGALLLPVDFDYIATPRNQLAARLRAISEVLATRAQAAPLDLLTTAAVMNAWYNTYTAPNANNPGVAADAAKIAAIADSSNNSVAGYLANDYRYFRPDAETALRLRQGLTETAGWLRQSGSGALASMDRRATILANGGVLQTLSRWSEGVWRELSADEGDYYTLNASGSLVYNSGTDYLQPRAISFADGNRVSFRMPNNGVTWSFEVADSPATNFFIEEWVGQQRSYSAYYNGKPPVAAPLLSKPACAVPYPGSPQPNNSAAQDASGWFSVCYDYYTAEYYDKVLGDLALKGSDPALPGANFYDAWLKNPLLVAPLTQNCGSAAIALGKVNVLGKSHCNWALDARGGHGMNDLFAADGVLLNSWSKNYGSASFGSNGNSTVRVAGSAERFGLPQQLRLRLQRSGNARAGTGTLYSEYGAWSATSYSPLTETIQWQISASNPNLLLISWPFRDVGDPRVKNNTASDGTLAASAPLLTAHFTATFNGNSFSVAPGTHTAPNQRKLALVLQDGIFMTGQYYESGFNYNERYFTIPAMERGKAAMDYVFGKLYATGFTDQ